MKILILHMMTDTWHLRSPTSPDIRGPEGVNFKVLTKLNLSDNHSSQCVRNELWIRFTEPPGNIVMRIETTTYFNMTNVVVVYTVKNGHYIG